jgi:dipeptidyl aminopeptidase/acylaminoacyl peptidase
MNDRFSRLVVATGILMIALAAGPAAGQDEKAATPRSLTVEDYFRILDVDEPQISPDGKWVAYTVTTSDIEKDESTSRIWMVPAAGGEPVPMTAKARSASHPRWSPDGRYLAFLAAPEDGTEQVWTLFRQGGEAVQLTDTAQDVQDFEWSPDGKRLVLVLQDPTPEELAVKQGEEKEKNPPPWVVTRRQFKVDYVGYLDSRRTHLYVLDVASKGMTQVTSGDFDDSEPSWSPDGERITWTATTTPTSGWLGRTTPTKARRCCRSPPIPDLTRRPTGRPRAISSLTAPPPKPTPSSTPSTTWRWFPQRVVSQLS